MFLDQELKRIQADKNRLSVCCDLRRRLVHVEVQDVWRGMGCRLSNLALGLAVAERIAEYLRERKGGRG